MVVRDRAENAGRQITAVCGSYACRRACLLESYERVVRAFARYAHHLEIVEYTERHKREFGSVIEYENRIQSHKCVIRARRTDLLLESFENSGVQHS